MCGGESDSLTDIIAFNNEHSMMMMDDYFVNKYQHSHVSFVLFYFFSMTKGIETSLLSIIPILIPIFYFYLKEYHIRC